MISYGSEYLMGMDVIGAIVPSNVLLWRVLVSIVLYFDCFYETCNTEQSNQVTLFAHCQVVAIRGVEVLITGEVPATQYSAMHLHLQFCDLRIGQLCRVLL